MKLAALILVYLALLTKASRTLDPVQDVLAKNDNPSCVGDCFLLKKVKAIFPLKGVERHLPSILNQFNWKFIAIYSDHMTVYEAPQSEPMVILFFFKKKKTDYSFTFLCNTNKYFRKENLKFLLKQDFPIIFLLIHY